MGPTDAAAGRRRLVWRTPGCRSSDHPVDLDVVGHAPGRIAPRGMADRCRLGVVRRRPHRRQRVRRSTSRSSNGEDQFGGSPSPELVRCHRAGRRVDIGCRDAGRLRSGRAGRAPRSEGRGRDGSGRQRHHVEGGAHTIHITGPSGGRRANSTNTRTDHGERAFVFAIIDRDAGAPRPGR